MSKCLVTWCPREANDTGLCRSLHATGYVILAQETHITGQTMRWVRDLYVQLISEAVPQEAQEALTASMGRKP